MFSYMKVKERQPTRRSGRRDINGQRQTREQVRDRPFNLNGEVGRGGGKYVDKKHKMEIYHNDTYFN